MNVRTPPPHSGLSPGFTDAVHEAQAVFHAATAALSRPGQIVPCASALAPPAPLTPLGAALALTLCDFETTLWLDEALAASAEVQAYLTFHTGARIVRAPGEAQFALVSQPQTMPDLASFAQGTLDYPDRSTTLIMQVTAFGEALRFSGPGIQGEVAFSVDPAPPDFARQLLHNRALFPQGVDFLFAGPSAVAALPRSASLTEG